MSLTDALADLGDVSAGDRVVGFVNELVTLGQSEGDLQDWATVTQVRAMTAAIVELSASEPGRAAQQARELVAAMEEHNVGGSAMADVQKALAPVLDETTEATADATAANEALEQSVEELEEAIKGLNTTLFGVTDAEAAWNDALADSVETQKEAAQAFLETGESAITAAGGFALNTEAGRESYAAMKDVVTSAQETVVALKDSGASAEDVAAKQAFMAEAVYQAGRQMGLSDVEARNYANGIRDIPTEVNTKVNLDTAQAEANFAEITRKFNEWSGATISVSVVADFLDQFNRPRYRFDSQDTRQRSVPRLTPVPRLLRTGGVDPTAQGASTVGRLSPRVKPATVNVFVDGVKRRTDTDPWRRNYARVAV